MFSYKLLSLAIGLMVFNQSIKLTYATLALPTCGTYPTAPTGNYCGLSPSGNTYCIYNDNGSKKIYEAKTTSCSTSSLTSGSYNIFKQKGETGGDDVTFTREVGTTGKYVVYSAGAGSVVTQVDEASDVYIFENDNKILLKCATGGECTPINTDGYYFAENRNKIVHCDGTDCAEESKVGIYIISAKIYSCTGTSSITCVDKTATQCESSGDIGKFKLNTDEFQLCKETTPTWVTLLKTTAYTGYRKVEKADAKIAFNIDDDILMKVKENTYAVKIDANAGYYVDVDNAGKLYYCSANGISKCSIVDASAGYYLLGGSDASPDSYIQCTGSACTEVEFGTYDTCGNDNDLEHCRGTIDPNDVCRSGAVEGEVCYHATTKKLYESGKASCYEVMDKNESRLFYFNAKHKRVLPESPLTLNPIIYDCDIAALPTCDATPPSTGTECKVSSEIVNFCIYSNVIYKTDGSDCVAANPQPEKICIKNENTLPACEVDGANPVCLKHGYCKHIDNKIYSKVDGTCTVFDVEVNDSYYYFDKNFEMIETINNNEIIYTSYKCQSTDTCEINGDKTVGELVRTPTSVEMCLADKKSISLTQSEQIYYSIAPSDSKFVVNLGGKASFLLKTTGKSIVKIVSLAAVTGDMATLPECYAAGDCTTDGSAAVNYCIWTDKVIYKKGSSSCDKLTSTTASSFGVTMFKGTGATLDVSSNGSDTKYAYRCSYDASKNSKDCLIVKGYIVSGNSVIGCSGYANDECVVTTITDCAATADGKIGKEGGKNCVCVGGKALVNVPSSATDKPTYIAYKSTVRNDIYEVEKNVFTLIEVGPNYAMKIKDYPTASGTFYFINRANPEIQGNSNSIPLIQCTFESNEVTGCVSEENAAGTSSGSQVKYYVDGADPKKVIRCTWTDKCESVVAVTESQNVYYINGEEGQSIIKCTKGTDGICSVVDSSLDGNNYIDNDDSKSVIFCSGGDCISEKFVGVIANPSTREGELYIQCKGSSACTYVTEAEVKVSSVLKIVSNVFNFKASDGSEYAEITKEGYEILSSDDASKVLGLSGSGLLVYVTSSTVKKVNILPGYYPRVNVATGLDNAVIYCSGNTISTCNKVSNIDPGYYLVPDKDNSVIKCDTFCAISNLDASCNENGGNIINDYKLCISNNANEAIPIYTSKETYAHITSASNVFPGAASSVDVVISPKGYINKLPKKVSDSLITCTDNDVSGTPDSPCNKDYCLFNNKIYKAGEDSCTQIEAKQGSTQYYYFDKDYKLVSSPKTSPSTVKYVYVCEFTADADHPNDNKPVSSCTQITTYKLINTQTAVYCNGLEGENCVVHDLNTCSGTELGKLGRNGVVCFGSRSVELPTGNGNKIIAFVPTDFNKYYGTYELIFLKLEANGVAVAANNEIVAGYYLNESATSLKDALVYCSDTGSEYCELVDGTNGYYVSSWGNDYVISCSSTGCSRVSLEYSTCGYNNILPECTRSGVQTDNVCSGTGVEGDNDTYCFGSDNKIYKNVVTGEGKSCALIEFTGEETSVSFGSDHKRENAVGTVYYTCSVSGTEISDCSLERKPLPECDSPIDANAECFNNAAAGSVCITSSGALYTTDEEGKCGVFKGTANTVLYFNESYEKVDFESPDSIIYTYKCTSTGAGGGLTNCVQASQVPGGVIKTSNSVAICASKDDSEKVDIAENKEYVEMKGVATGFPSVESTDEIVTVKVTGDQNVMQLRDKASLPTCSNAGSTTEECKVNGEEVANCIKNNIIYKSEYGSTCTKLTGDPDTEDFKFFQKNLSESTPGTNEVFYAYQCKYNSSGKASYCKFAQGIVVSGSHTVNCNGWKGDECTVAAKGSVLTCSAGEGSIRSGAGSICFDSNNVDLPTDDYIYTAFTAAEINSIYGKLKDEIVLLKLTKDSALVASYSDLGDEEKYLIDQTNKENADGKTPLILCKAGECSSVESGTKDKIKDGEDNVKEEGIVRTYYIDGAYPFGNQIITCTQAEIKEGQVTEGSCTSSSPGDVSYYVDSAIDGNIISCGKVERPLGYGDFSICSDVPSGENACKVNDSPIIGNGIYCVKDGLIYVSNSDTASCSAVKTCISVTSPFGLYATGSSVDNEKIIVCDGEDGIKCHYTKNVSSESDCVDAEDNTKPANEGVIYIDGSSAGFMQCHEGKGEVLNRNTQGYMLLDEARASKFLQGVTEPLLIENNAATYMVASTIQDGYYYNIGFDMLTNSVIRCTKTSGCEAIDMDDVHCKGDHTKLPICTNIESDKACREYDVSETNMEHCIYNGKIYKNVNEDEVKCREIQALDECESVEESAKCIANASANSLCLHEGNMYINLENGCKAVNTLDTCESILSNDKCASEAEDNDLCRFGNGVYKTSSNSCQMVTTLIDEVGRIPLYFDSTAALTTTATTLSVKSKYICNNKYGVLSSCEKAVQDIGGLIFTRSERVKVVHVCVNGSSDETKYSYEITRQNGYQTIDIGKSDIFPGMTNPGKTVIDFEKNKALLVHEQETIPECDGITNGSGCKSNGVPVAQCIMNNVLYLSDGNTCTKQTGPSNSYDFTYFDPSSTIIDPVNVKPNKKVEFVYKCEYNSSGVAERCYMVRGYVVVNDYILNCNGWSSCSFTGINNLANGCQDTSEGEIMGNGHVICLDEYNVELPTYESTYIMFKTETTNAIYGQKENAVVVLSLTPDSATVVPNGKGITKGYHQNVKVVGELTDALIYCSEDGVLESCDVVSGLNGYYLNTDSDGSYYAVIKCEEGLGCRKQIVDKTSCNEAGALIKSGNKISICKTASNSGKIDLNPDVATLTYDYISPIDASFPGSIEENKAFVKVGTDGSVVLLDNGIYINEGIHGKIDKALYDCTTLNVTTICDPVDALYGYYRNAGTVGLDDAFISCSLNGCEVMSVDENAVCSVNSIGQLVGSTDAPTLCLDYDDEMDEEKKVVLESESDESYMVGYYSNNIFGLQEGNYAYVNVTQNYVKFRSPDYVKYVYTENSYKELSGKECQANTGLNPKTLNEFKIKDFGVYSLNCVDGEDEDNLLLSNCADPPSGNNCGVSPNAPSGNSFCIYTKDSKIYETRQNGCSSSPISLTSGSYYIFKQKSKDNDNDKVTFTREVDSDASVNHVVYKAGASNTVEHIKSKYIFDSDKKVLLNCDSDGKCNSDTNIGYYFAENREKIVHCDGTECAEENKVGIYFKGTQEIYKCTGTTNIRCENKYSSSDCSSTTAGILKENSNEIEVCNGSGFVSIKFDKSNDVGYRIISEDVSTYAFGVSGGILVKVDNEGGYAVKVDQKTGYYVNADKTGISDNLYYCSDDNNLSKCTVVKGVPGYYALGGASASPDSYIKCTDSACTEVPFVSYDTCGNYNDIKRCNDPINPNEVCSYGAVEGEVCYHATSKKLYESGKASCYEVVDKKQSRLQYFNTKHKRVLPESTLTSNPIIYDCDVSAVTGKFLYCVKNENVLPPCVDNGSDICLEHGYCIHTDGKIYSKVDGTCTVFDVAEDNTYYYFDKNFEMIETINNNEVIYTSYKCQSDDTCEINGDKTVGELIRTPTSVEMCLDIKKSISLTQSEQIYYSIAPSNSKFVVNLGDKDSFLLKTTGKSIVKIVSLAAVQSDMATLPTCKGSPDADVCKDNESPNPEVNYCILNDVIYKKGSTSCDKLTSTTASSVGITMFKGTGATVDVTTTVGEAEYAYRCLYDDNNSEDCFIVKGYVVSSSSVIGCSGYANDKCVVTAITNCASTVDGKIGKEGGKISVCVGGKALVNATEKPTYVAYKSTTTNDIYEDESDEDGNVYNLIEVGPNYAMKIKNYPIQNGDFYFINSANPEIKENSYSVPLIKCSIANNEVTGCVSAGDAAGTSSDSPVKFYVDGSDFKNVIKCTWTGKCESVVAVTTNLAEGKNVYYVNGDDNRKVIKCTGGSSGSCRDESTSNGDYFIDNNDDKSIISCTGTACTSEKFIGIVAIEDDEFIQCTGSSTCNTISSVPSNNAFEYNKEDDVFKIKGSNNVATGGYQLVSAEDARALINSNTGVIVKVTTSSIKKVNISAGYYPVIDVTDNLSKALIHCTGTTYSSCVVEDAKSGYYTFPDSNENVIKCDNVNYCTEEPYIDDELLPICKKTGPLANDVCSGQNNDDENNNKCCLGTDGVIYKNTVTGSGSTKYCTALHGASKGIQYFAFDDDHKEVETLNNADTIKVHSTYKCIVDNTLAISKCTLVGNHLPTCEKNVGEEGACFTSGDDGTVCMHSNGSLLTTSTNCIALTGKAKGVYYFGSDYKKIDPVTNLNNVKFIYYCYGGGVSTDADLTDCIPIHGNIGALITGVKGTVPMMRVSAFDSENVKIGETSAKYLTLPKYNSFPGADLANKLPIEVSTLNKIVPAPTKTTNELPSCSAVVSNSPCKQSSDNSPVPYCYESNFIYEKDGDTCTKVQDAQGSTQYYYFDENYDKVVTPTASPTALKYAYQLKFAAASPEATSTVESFKQITYYQKIDSNPAKAVYCNGLENEPCVIHAIGNCGSNDIGKLGKANSVDSVCFGSNKGVALPTDESSKIIAFKPTDFNKYYSESELTFLKLTKDTVKVADPSDAKKGYYLNEAASGLTNALVYCSADGSTNCNVVDASVGYYVSSYGYGNVISCSSTGCKLENVEYASCGYENLLPKCERDGSATEVCFGDGSDSFNDKHCLGSDERIYKNVVSADGNKCEPITLTSESPSVSFNDNVGTKASSLGYTYYTCTVSGESISNCVLERKPLPDCTATINNESPCFENADPGTVCITSGNSLLKTSEDGKCEALTGSISKLKYFKEDYTEGDVTNAKYTYKCSSNGSGGSLTGCALVHQVPGGVIRSGNGLAMCSSLDDSEIISIGNEKEYKEVQVSGFPDITTETDIIIKNTGRQAVIQLKEKASLPTCNNAGSVSESCKAGSDLVQYCIKNSVIYKSESGKCVRLEDYDTRDGFAFFSKYATKANPVSESVSSAYYCVFGYDGKATNCSFAQGIIKTGSKVVTCNGWKEDECVVTDKVNTAICTASEGEGGIKKGEEGICFGSHSEGFPTDGYKYAAFTTAEINPTYGIIGRKHVMLKMTPNSALVTSYTGETPIYLIDLANPSNSDGKTPLIVCDCNDCSSIESGTQDQTKDTEQNTVVVKGIAHTYYIDGAYPFGNKIITCTQSEFDEDGGITTQGYCTSGNPVDNSSGTPVDVSYYMDSANEGNVISCGEIERPLGYGDIPLCSSTSPYDECKINGEDAAEGVHCVKNGKLYVTGSGSCSVVKTCQSITSPFGLYATGSLVTNEKLIVCDGEEGITCHYVKNVESVSDCVDATDPTQPANEGVIYIDESQGFMQCREGKGVALNRKIQGYMLLDVDTASKFLQGVTEPILMENNVLTYMVASTIQDGYYYNIGFDMLTNSVIRCTENSGCEAIDIDYVHCKGDHTKLPICTNIESDKVCREYSDSEVSMEHCIYNGKIYRNVSEDEVKCREIQALEVCESVEENAKCIENASVNSLCLHEGSIYINLENGCKAVNTLDTCESTSSGDKCASEVADNDLCRFDNVIYKTSSSSCEKVTSLFDDVGRIPLYFDSTAALTTTVTTSLVKSMYICNNKYGVLSSCEKAVQDVGGLIFTRSVYEKVVHVCINGSSDSYDITSRRGYQTIHFEKSDIFPGMTNPGKTVIDFEKNKAILVHEQAPLPECDAVSNSSGCKSEGVPVAQCIMNDVLYLSNGNTCSKQTGPSNGYDFTYFDPSSTIIDPVSVKPNKKVEFVYKCEYNGSGVAERCYMVRGYVVVNDYILNCNGWSSCSFTGINNLANSCQDTGEGEMMGNGHVICLDESTFVLPNSGSTYIMFKTETTNAIYGQKENDVVVLSLTPDSATVVPNGKGITKGYHQNVKVVGELTDALIYCSEDGVLESCDVVSGLNGYYLNTDSDGSYYAVFKCEEGLGCRKQTVDKTSCTEAGALIKSGNKISLCKTASNLGKIDLNPDVATLTYDYISPIDASFPGSIEENKAFVKVGTDGSVVLLDNGIYINEGIHGKIDKALYDCTTLNVTTICDPVDALYGYYRNAGTVGLDDAFISCSLNGCEVMSVDEDAVCSVNSIGQLVGSTDAPTLCLDYDDEMDEEKKVVLESESDESYMVGYYSNNIFGLQEGNYAYVNVTQNYVKFRSPDYVKYVYTENSYKELSGRECQANTGLNPKTLNEFKFEDFGIYTLNCVEDEDEDNLCKKNNA